MRWEKGNKYIQINDGVRSIGGYDVRATWIDSNVFDGRPAVEWQSPVPYSDVSRRRALIDGVKRYAQENEFNAVKPIMKTGLT